MKASRDAYATALTKYSEERSKWQAEQESQPNASQQDGEKDDGREQRLRDLGIADRAIQHNLPSKSSRWTKRCVKRCLRFVLSSLLWSTFKWTSCMPLSCLLNQSLKPLYSTLEKSDEKPPTENTARKNLYAELVSFWPEGWITSSELSRGWSQQRKKFLSK